MLIKKRAIHEEQKLERRNLILDTAFNLFVKSSYQQVSMNQVATRANLAKGTLYLYFKSKEELFLALKGREYHQWFDEIEIKLNRFPALDSKKKKIERFIRVITKSIDHREEMVRLILSLHHVLERNIEPKAILKFNQEIGSKILKIGNQLEGIFPFLGKRGGVRLLFYIKTIILGMSHVAEPVSVIKKSFENPKPELKVFEINMQKEISKMLRAVLFGWS